ncbi:hypothetical protein QTI33_08545 [Variovorax sp. J22P271]|uniref:hypothetical protein n=1 Tax=Variovorax davisae TaxID=3053515 RepID=UPI002578EF39|nr:hypothetical protein [Variovorax sp. J22P271]MDM0032182.1 hypothetical protein [Variovorax sp. J22P271]
MPILLLRQLATQLLPMNVSDRDKIDELRVLVQAGLIAALEVREGDDRDRPKIPTVRILAITGDGRRLLQRSAQAP